MAGCDIIVIGGSAGGLEAVEDLARLLPADLPAAVFVTLHLYSGSDGFLLRMIERAGPLPAANAEDGEPIRAGRIYLAPVDHHLLLTPGQIHLSHGPKENMQRPCINAMFRSAAATYGERVAGVLLTGLLDDGVAGLWEIQERHGVTIVQDPEEATFRSMPESAIRGLNVQYIVRVREMANLLSRVSMADPDRTHPGKLLPPIYEPSRQACPECGGAMTSVRMGEMREYRCHIGHRLSLQTMIAQKRSVIEQAMSKALAQSEELTELLERALQEPADGSPDELRKEIARRSLEQETLRSLTGNDTSA